MSKKNRLDVRSYSKPASSRNFPYSDVLFQNGNSFLHPGGDVDGIAPRKPRIEDDDTQRQEGNDEGDERVENREIPEKKRGVDKVANQVESRPDNERPVEPVFVRVSPIQRTPRDDAPTKVGLVPENDVGEMLTHLQGGEPTQLTQIEEVGGEDGQRVEEEIEPLADQVLPRQHAQAEEDHKVGENVVSLEKEENRRSPNDARIGIGPARRVFTRCRIHFCSLFPF